MIVCERGTVVNVDQMLLPGIDYADKDALVQIDLCISDLVIFLNERGVVTIGSCCGHGEGDGWISVKDVVPIEHIYNTMHDWIENNDQARRDCWYIRILPNVSRNIRLLQKPYWDRPGGSKPCWAIEGFEDWKYEVEPFVSPSEEVQDRRSGS